MGPGSLEPSPRWEGPSTTLPPWLFCTRSGNFWSRTTSGGSFARASRRAKLPRHFTPHCLRHTFASVLLQDGESAQYVQEQLGRASLTITTQTYGRWLPKRPVRGGVNILGDVLIGSKLGSRSLRQTQKRPEKNGEPCWDRTSDPLIKSQALYQLS
jgi:Phage integrase family